MEVNYTIISKIQNDILNYNLYLKKIYDVWDWEECNVFPITKSFFEKYGYNVWLDNYEKTLLEYNKKLQ